jgi:hypothetical protein
MEANRILWVIEGINKTWSSVIIHDVVKNGKDFVYTYYFFKIADFENLEKSVSVVQTAIK